MTLLALCPSRMRPQQAKRLLASFEATRGDPASRLVFIVDSDDPALDEYPGQHTVVVRPTGCMGFAMQEALPDVLGDATVVGMVGDDNLFLSQNFDLIFSKWLEARSGIAYGDDLYQHQALPTSWWLHRPLVDEFGITLPTLRHLYMDRFWQTLGQDTHSLRYFPEVVIEHIHPDTGKVPTDEIYLRGSAPSSPNATLDRATFESWRDSPERHEMAARLRQIVRAGRKEVNVLVDYHHGSLWESLELLLVDRFGWNLYRPVGPEWFQQGYWRFINMPMNLDWPDFLAIGKPGSLVDGHIELPGTQYPRTMKGVTLEQARAMGWDYIIASVWQHQGSFAKLAQEFGAEFVHQIGNAFNEIDWRLPAKYLISANLRAESPKAVTYHQEFDTRIFRYRKPGRDKRVANFVLRFNWQADAYSKFKQAEALAPEFEWADHGTLYGDLVAQADVAATMSEQSFIWHDKPIGDGYGHAIHNAAAVGRPVVGHARHYQGRLAEPFWRDGETCIDLDKHSVVEAVEMMREIMSNPARHRAMCEAMYETFRATVNFDEDAAKVRALLTA